MYCAVSLGPISTALGIILTGVGVCAAYVNFLTSTLPGVLNEFMGRESFDQRNVNIILAPAILLLAYLRNFKYLSFTSVLGDVAVTAGMVEGDKWPSSAITC